MSKSLEHIGITHASGVVEAERRLVSTGFRYPGEFLHHSNTHELCGGDFAIPAYGAVFQILIECALREESPTVYLVYTFLCAIGYPPRLDAEGYPQELARLLLFTEVVPTGIAHNVEIVATFARHRREAQEYIRKAEALLLGDLKWLSKPEAENRITVVLPSKRNRGRQRRRRKIA